MSKKILRPPLSTAPTGTAQGQSFLQANLNKVALFIGVTLLVALISGTSFWAFSEIKKAAEIRTHTTLLINRASNLLSLLKDAETGQRGYALTGDETFLEPYSAVRDGIVNHLEELRGLTLLSAARKHLDALFPLIVAKLAELSQVIALRRNHDMPAVLAVVSSGQGKQLMDSIRTEISSFIQIEEVALAQNDTALQSNMRQLFIIIVATSLFTLVFALAFAYLFYRQTQQRLNNLVHLKTQHLLKTQEQTNKLLLQANATLQINEEKLAVTLSSIGDAVIATDAQACVSLLNPLAEQLTGWTQAQAGGRPVAEIFHIINKETRHPAIIPVMETLEQGTIQGLANHTVLIARDGSEYDIADSCAPIRDRDNTIVGAVLVFRNVTEEYVIQQALRESEERLNFILQMTHTGG